MKILHLLNFHNPLPELFLKATKNIFLSAQTSAYMNMHQLPRYDVTNRVEQICIPALLAIGQYDWITPLDDSQHIAKDIPHAKLLLFENSGHFPFVEEPKKFQSVLTDFLNHLSIGGMYE